MRTYFRNMRMALSYLQYRANAKNLHGVHSPFIYKLNEEVIRKKNYPTAEIIEAIRGDLKSDRTQLDLVDLGAGSRVSSSNTRTVSEIARVSSGSKKDLALLHNLALWTKTRTAIELGTNLGLSAIAIGSVPSIEKLISIEGDPKLAEIAVKNLEKAGIKADVLQGSFEDKLDLALANLQNVDFAYIDGNHQFEPTIEYFQKIENYTHNNSVVVLGDIHWSNEMEKAWEEIKYLPSVKATVDLFSMGLVFFKNELSKEHFILHG